VNLKRWLPIMLLLIAFAMRVLWLADVPPGLHHDEVIYINIAEKALAGGWSIFYPEGQGREGFYIPFLAAARAWLGTGTFALRAPSLFLSTLSLCAVYALARRLFGRFVALFALAEMSVTFWSVYPGRVAMRAVTEPLMAALAAYALWRAVTNLKSQVSNLKWSVLAGALIGLTVYTYRGARALPGIVVLLPLYLALFDRAALERAWRGLIVCAGMALLVAAPLVVLLDAHPGLDQLDWAGRDQVLKTLGAGDVRPALKTTAATLGAFFWRGDPDDYYNLQGRPVFEPVTGALFVLGVLIALWQALRGRPSYGYLLMWFVLALAPGRVSEPAPHFYRIIGAQVTAFVFPAVALENLKSRFPSLPLRTRLLKFEVWPLILAALVAADGAWNAHDYFITWANKDTVRVLWNAPMADTARYLDHSDEQTPVAVCSLLINPREAWLRPAYDFFRYLMRRDASALRFYDCRYSLVLPGLGTTTRYAFPGTAPMDQFVSRFFQSWLRDQDIEPVQGIPVSGDNALVRADQRLKLDTKFKQLAPTQKGLPADFGHAIRFRGYELPTGDLKAGQAVVLVTWWQVEQPSLSPNLTLFTHVLQGEHIIAQQDLLSVTPNTLRPGDVFAQVHEFITIPADAAPGDYALAIGLYDSASGRRLTIYNGETPAGDRLTLTTIHIR
jgi:hypothetical protein